MATIKNLAGKKEYRDEGQMIVRHYTEKSKHPSAKKKAIARKMGKAPTKKEVKDFNKEQPEDYRYKHLHD